MVDQTVSQSAQRCSLHAELCTLDESVNASVCLRSLALGTANASRLPLLNASTKFQASIKNKRLKITSKGHL